MCVANVYTFLTNGNVLSIEQNGWSKRSRDAKNNLVLYKIITGFSKYHTNIYMVWIDFKKTYDMIFHFFEHIYPIYSMKEWKAKLYLSNGYVGKVTVKSGNFYGVSFSESLFVNELIPITMSFRHAKMSYQ